MDDPELLPAPGQVEDVVVQRLDGFPARLRRTRDGALVLETPDGRPLPALGPGERLRITRPVEGDATYVQAARVVEVDPAHPTEAVLRSASGPQRHQQRRHVRVRAKGVQVAFLGEEGRDAVGQLLDVSASGARAALEQGNLEVGRRLHLRFTLPDAKGDKDLSLAGEVVWARVLADGREAVGVEFHDLDDRAEAELTRWALSHQARTTLSTRDRR